MDSTRPVLPGDILGPTSKYSPGPGTYVHNKSIIAAVHGTPTTSRRAPSTSKDPPTVLSVHRPPSSSTPLLPSVGTTVYALVTNVTRQQATCSIVALSSPRSSSSPTSPTLLAPPHPLRGILRSLDVRATEKDRVAMHSSYRVGDAIRACVISVGDQGGYFLSTAGNEWGVVLAWSEGGNGCVPVSWKEVEDRVTGVREERKVARPV